MSSRTTASGVLPADHLAPNSYAANVPQFVLQTSPAAAYTRNATFKGQSGALALPLNLLARIISYLDDIGDMARVTRTSRLLYYLTLPHLYKAVSLRSYPETRYVNGRPDGYGSGSAFMMALNGLMTKNHVSLVEEFRIWGQWKELNASEFVKGKVPDNSMMLNILLRAVLDRMCKLQYFIWELDTKPLKTVYEGLSASQSLSRLTLLFPSSRLPRPAVVIPPIPNLRALKCVDIDPLCYPDDISLLLLGSKKLRDVRLHFSPRMRREAESSLALEQYFGRCAAAGYRPLLEHLGIRNFFGPNRGIMDLVVRPGTFKSVTFIDMFGGATGNPANKYIDDTWMSMPQGELQSFPKVRCNEMASQHVATLSRTSGTEQIYWPGSKSSREAIPTPSANGTAVTPESPQQFDRDAVQALGMEYVDALAQHHGSTLTHVLLHDRWALKTHDAAELVRHCPKLKQLGLAMQLDGLHVTKLLLPFFKDLIALRFLENEYLTKQITDSISAEDVETMMITLHRMGKVELRWIGFGDRVFEVADREVQINRNGRTELGTEVIEVGREAVGKIDIWMLDTLSLDADPIIGLV